MRARQTHARRARTRRTASTATGARPSPSRSRDELIDVAGRRRGELHLAAQRADLLLHARRRDARAADRRPRSRPGGRSGTSTPSGSGPTERSPPSTSPGCGRSGTGSSRTCEGSGYVNHLAADDRPEKVRASYGENYARLRELKARLRPDEPVPRQREHPAGVVDTARRGHAARATRGARRPRGARARWIPKTERAEHDPGVRVPASARPRRRSWAIARRLSPPSSRSAGRYATLRICSPLRAQRTRHGRRALDSASARGHSCRRYRRLQPAHARG